MKTSHERQILAKRKERRMRVATLIMLGLLFIGFTIAGYWGMSQRTNEPTSVPVNDTETPTEYGLGANAGSANSQVSSLTGHQAIYGQLSSALSAKRQLNGELYALDGGYTQLILTDVPESDIRAAVEGEYIIYKTGICDDFDCLVSGDMAANLTNTTFVFYLYQLDRDSQFLETSIIGLPTPKVDLDFFTPT